jgi:RHS repeat-associated protein
MAARSQTFDSLGRVLTRTTPDGVTAFDYRQASLNPPFPPGFDASVALDAVLVKDPKGNLTEQLFDGDRLVRADECKIGVSPLQTDLSGVTCEFADSTFYAYEASGELDTIYDAHPDQDFASAARRLRYRYDTLGRIWKVSDPDRGVSYTDRDLVGNVVRTLDARGRVITYHYDALNRMQLIDTPGGAGDWDQLEIEYDPNTRKRSSVTATGMTYSESWEYDDFGNPEKNVRNVIGRTLRTDFGYDLLGRLRTLKSPLSSRDSVNYVYNGAYLSEVCSGQDASNCETSPEISYIDGVVYDPLGRVTAISEPHGALTYDYYDVNDPSDGRIVNQLKSMALDGSRLALAYTYDENGNVSHIADTHSGDSLDATADYLYDRRNRLASWKNANQIEKHFAYDWIGNLVGRNLPAAPNGDSDWNQVYDYSNKPHAIRMNRNDKGYDYDATGNAVRRGGEYLSYNSLGQLHCVGDSQGSCNGGFFWYDIDGNLLTKSVGSTSEVFLGDYFRFDTGANIAWTYTSAFGKRIAMTKKAGAILRAAWAPPKWPLPIDRDLFFKSFVGAGLLGLLALFAWLGAFAAIADRPVAACVALGVSVLIAAPPQAWALRRGKRQPTVIRYLFHDHLGTEVLSTNVRGDVEERRIFEPFGEVIASENDPNSSATATFTGKQYHDELSLYNFGARWYDAEAGRFVSVDPVVQSVSDPQTHNPYGYVRNNPIGFVDPDGRTIEGGAVLGILAIIAYYSAQAYIAYSSIRGLVESFAGTSGAETSQRSDSVVAQNTLTVSGESAAKAARSTARNYESSPESQSGSLLRPDAYEFSGAFGLGLVGGVRVRFSGTGEFEGFSLFGGIGAAARFQGAGAAGGSASKQLPGVSEGNPSRFTFGSIFSASLVPISPVSPTLGFDTEIGSGEFVNAQGTGGVAVGPLPVLVCAPCVNVNFSRSESLSILRALSVPPERSLMAGDYSGR